MTTLPRTNLRQGSPTVCCAALMALALLGGSVSVAEGREPEEALSIPGLCPGNATTAWSPDGRWLAAVTMPGYAVNLWRAREGELARTWPEQKVEVYDVVFSPNSPTSTATRSGSPAISPHSETGRPARRAATATRRSRRRTPGDAGS